MKTTFIQYMFQRKHLFQKFIFFFSACFGISFGLQAQRFGNGSSGSPSIGSNTIVNTYYEITGLSWYSYGNAVVNLALTPSFGVSIAPPVDSKVMLIIMDGNSVGVSNPGKFAFGNVITSTPNSATVEFINLNSLTTIWHEPNFSFLNNNAKKQLIVVPQYQDLDLCSGSITAHPYSESSGTGGIVSFFVNGTLTIGSNSINISHLGFDGKPEPNTGYIPGTNGEPGDGGTFGDSCAAKGTPGGLDHQVFGSGICGGGDGGSRGHVGSPGAFTCLDTTPGMVCGGRSKNLSTSNFPKRVVLGGGGYKGSGGAPSYGAAGGGGGIGAGNNGYNATGNGGFAGYGGSGEKGAGSMIYLADSVVYCSVSALPYIQAKGKDGTGGSNGGDATDYGGNGGINGGGGGNGATGGNGGRGGGGGAGGWILHVLNKVNASPPLLNIIKPWSINKGGLGGASGSEGEGGFPGNNALATCTTQCVSQNVGALDTCSWEVFNWLRDLSVLPGFKTEYDNMNDKKFFWVCDQICVLANSLECPGKKTLQCQNKNPASNSGLLPTEVKRITISPSPDSSCSYTIDSLIQQIITSGTYSINATSNYIEATGLSCSTPPPVHPKWYFSCDCNRAQPVRGTNGGCGGSGAGDEGEEGDDDLVTLDDTCTLITCSWAVIGPTSICNGDLVQWSANGPYSFRWYPGNLIGNTVNLSPGSTTIYTVVATDSYGVTVSLTKTLTVNLLPTVGTAVTNATICAGQSTNITATGASTYTWQPGSLIGNNVSVSPPVTTTYTVTGTDINGCTNSNTINVYVNPAPSLGTAIASPSSILLGATLNLNYSAPTGMQCNGANQSGFAGFYSPNNWTTTNTNSNGSVNVATAPSSITLISSNNLTVLPGSTDYSITAPCTGIVSFNWSYATTDGPFWDYPRYIINGGSPVIFPGFVAINGTSNTQSGTFTVLLSAGETLTLQSYSVDNFGGSCSTVISNFSAPYQTPSTQIVTWFTAPTGGINLGNSNPQNYTPANIGAYNYYAQISNTITGCINSTRAITNLVTVNTSTISVSATANPNTICAGGSSVLTASGALIYSWQPGNLSGTSIIVSPTTTTIYTVTGTSSNGSTGTAIRTITVNPTPSVSTTVTNATICAGSSTSITGTGAVNYTWQPGALTGTTINVSPSTTTTYTVTGTAANGCTNSAIRVINVLASPTVGTTVTNGTICAGASTSITGTGAVNYTWQPGALSGTTINVTPLATTTYSVIGTAANGCTNSAIRVINVLTSLTVGTTVTNATICAGSSTSITGTGAVNYTWQPGALSGTTINVTPNVTTTYTVTGTAVNGCTKTAIRVINVLTSLTVGTTVTNATICAGSSTSITGTGAVNYTWQPGALTGTTINVSPLATTTYTVTGTAASCCTKTATRTITVNPCGATLNLTAFIEGYYLGASFMSPVLFNQGVSSNSNVTDSITVQLRNATSPFGLAYSIKALLHTNGTASISVPTTGTYYIAIKHRNALETWSANPLAIGNGTTTYNFSNSASKAYGSNQVQVSSGVWALYSGDIAIDQNIDLLDVGSIESAIDNFLSGYYPSDINGDGNVDLLDVPTVESNAAQFIFSQQP